MKRVLVLVCALALGAVPSAWAQISAGNIYGTVTDESDAVLPGATISIVATSIGGNPLTTVSGTQGEFRFLNLDHGTYKMTISLPGFATVQRDVIVSTGVSTNVTFNLKVATIEETITVSAESPVVDTKKLGTSTTLTKDELASVPNGRDPWVVVQSVPGILVDRVNIAGNESGQQSVFTGKGSAFADTMWTLDGVVITDTTSGGATSTYFDYDAFDEIAVNTGGNDLRVQTGGIGLNFVTKRGTNGFHGSIRGFFANDSLESSNLPSELKNDPRLQLPDGTFSDKGDHIDQILDYGADLGGPVVKDKVWFWASYGKIEPRIIRLTQTKDRTVLKNYNAKVNWQAGSKDMFSFFWFNGAKEKFGRSPGQVNNEPTSFLWNQGNFYPEDGVLHPLHGLWKLEDNHVFNPNFVVNAKYAYYGWGYGFRPIGGADQDGGVDVLEDTAYGSWNGFTARKPWHIVDVSGSYFKAAMGGNHEFKFGFGYRRNPNKTTTTWSGTQVVGFRQTAADSFAWVTRQRSVAFIGENSDFFVGDTFSKGPVTVNGGIRWDRQTSKNQPSTAIANPAFPELLPALSYDGSGPSIKWNDLWPRVGVTYAVGANRKTVARASYARYAGQLNPFEVTSISPVGGYYTFIAYNWVDLNGDHLAQRNEVLTNLSPQYSNNIDPNNPTSASSVNLLDPKYHSNKDDEFIVGVDREVAPNFSLGVAYTYHRSGELPSWNPRIGLTQADYTSNPPETAEGFTAQTFSPDPDKIAASNSGRILTNRPDYHTGYHGIEIQATRRLANRWQMRAAFSYGDPKEYFDGPGAVQQPTRTDSTGSPPGQTSGPQVDGGEIAPRSYGAKRNIFFNAKWGFHANALYQLPYGLEVAGNLTGRQGYPQPIVFSLGAGDDGTLRALGTARIDDVRYDALWDLDLRIAKKTRFMGKAGVDITADLFNALNSDLVLEHNRFATSNAFGNINEVISPRVLRIGLRFTF